MLAVSSGAKSPPICRFHRDTRMCELHYAHLPPGHVRDAIREGAPKFGFKPDSKVALLRG